MSVLVCSIDGNREWLTTNYNTATHTNWQEHQIMIHKGRFDSGRALTVTAVCIVGLQYKHSTVCIVPVALSLLTATCYHYHGVD